MLDRISSLSARIAPWAIIGGLAYAAVFIKVDVDANAMPQPLLEQRDQFFGGTGTTQALWFVGQGGSTLTRAQNGHWQRDQLQPAMNLQSVAASDAGVLVAVGNAGHVWVRAGDAGWSMTRLPLGDFGNKLLDVAFIEGQFWIVGEMGALFRGDAQGLNWTRAHEPDDVAYNRVRPGPEGSIWVPAEFGRLLSSRDGGATWESLELGSESLQSIAFSGNDGLVVGNRGEAFRSEDGGVTWTPANAPDNEHLYDVIAQGDGWIATGDRGALFQISRAGTRWQAVQPAGLGKGYHARVLATDEGVVLIGRDLGLVDQSGTYHSWPDAQGAVSTAGVTP